MENETWIDIEGFEGVYQISTLLRVRRLPTIIKHPTGSDKKHKGGILKIVVPKRDFYPSLDFCYKNVHTTILMHRLVAKTFIPNPENKPDVNHINGNKKDYSIQNLEWCTPAENELHKIHTLNCKPAIKNFKVFQTDLVYRYKDKNIYGYDLQELLIRFIRGEVICVKDIPHIQKRRFYSKINELRYRYNAPILARNNGTKYKEFFLNEDAEIDMSNKQSKGACAIWKV